MRATRAYLASAGTAVVMLGASLAMLALVSALVAFGSWPGQDSEASVDQVLLDDVATVKPKSVAVGAEAVKVAQRADTRRALVAARRQAAGSKPGARNRSVARTRAGTPVASAPGGAATPARGAVPGAVQGPANTVRQQAQGVAEQVQTTTRDVGTTVQNQVGQVQTQVNEVVDQVAGGLPPQAAAPVEQVQTSVGNTVTTVTNTAGSVLGH